MPRVVASGTQVSTVGEEHVLVDLALPGTFRTYVDMSAMQSGDSVELRAYLSLLGSKPMCVLYESWEGAQVQADSEAALFPLTNDLESPSSALRYTLKQRAGSSRSFDWRTELRQGGAGL